MSTLKKGFTLIELMIVVAVMAILSMVAVSQYQRYIEKAKDASVQALLHNLALAQLTLKTIPGHVDFLPIDGVASIPNISALAELGFRVDQTVGFAAIPYPGPPDPVPSDGYFILFAAHASKNSKLYVYNFVPSAGVRPYDPAADYAAVLPLTLTAFKWDESRATAVAIVDVDASSGMVTSVTHL